MALDLSSFKKSLDALAQVIQLERGISEESDLKKAIQAGVIQHFEMSYEISWKMLKRWLAVNFSDVVVDGVSRRELYRLGAESQLVYDVEQWMLYHRYRNMTTHTYNVETANAVMDIIEPFYFAASTLYKNIASKND